MRPTTTPTPSESPGWRRPPRRPAPAKGIDLEHDRPRHQTRSKSLLRLDQRCKEGAVDRSQRDRAGARPPYHPTVSLYLEEFQDRGEAGPWKG